MPPSGGPPPTSPNTLLVKKCERKYENFPNTSVLLVANRSTRVLNWSWSKMAGREMVKLLSGKF